MPAPSAPFRQAGNRALSATWRFLVLAVAVAVIAVTLAQSLRIYFAQAEEIAALRLEIKTGHEQIADLQDQIERWDDPRFIRAEARQRLGWVMPGETGYRVIGRDGEPIGGDPEALAEPIPEGAWFERLWGSVVAADQLLPEEESADVDPEIVIAPSPEPSSSEE